MPITQNRMIALLAAAQAARTSLKNAANFTRELSSSITPETPAPDLLSALQAIQSYMALLSLSPEHLETIATEQAHFKLNAARNTRHAARARKKRAKHSPHAPAALPSSPSIDPYLQPAPMSDADLSSHINIELCLHKKKINELYAELGQPAPYPDIYDDSQALAPDHALHLGLPTHAPAALF